MRRIVMASGPVFTNTYLSGFPSFIFLLFYRPKYDWRERFKSIELTFPLLLWDHVFRLAYNEFSEVIISTAVFSHMFLNTYFTGKKAFPYKQSIISTILSRLLSKNAILKKCEGLSSCQNRTCSVVWCVFISFVDCVVTLAVISNGKHISRNNIWKLACCFVIFAARMM